MKETDHLLVIMDVTDLSEVKGTKLKWDIADSVVASCVSKLIFHLIPVVILLVCPESRKLFKRSARGKEKRLGTLKTLVGHLTH